MRPLFRYSLLAIGLGFAVAPALLPVATRTVNGLWLVSLGTVVSGLIWVGRKQGTMSLRLNVAALRTYDALKTRPGASPRRSDARDLDALDAVTNRLRELIGAYRINGHTGPNKATYIFWTEVSREINAGAFDDLLDRL